MVLIIGGRKISRKTQPSKIFKAILINTIDRIPWETLRNQKEAVQNTLRS